MSKTISRLQNVFSNLKTKGRSALISYVVAGDPTPEASAQILHELVRTGTDIIELGIPFTDPMADGPTIQKANIRALEAGMTLAKTLDMVRSFRAINTTTPIVLMGYYNPLYIYGIEKFAKDAAEAGIDGLLTVDIPPEEDAEIKPHLQAHNIDLIRLITPTSTGARLQNLVTGISGYIYYVSMAGITGTKAINVADVAEHIAPIRALTDLPIAVGFGIRTAPDAAAISKIADGVVIGSSYVNAIEKTIAHQVVSEVGLTNQRFSDALA